MDARCPECEKVAVLDDEITKIKSIEQKIDQIVYKIYGLAKDEIETIENSLK